MQYSVALLALAAVVYGNPVSYNGGPIPACGWTTTLITEAGATDTVPIPLASADCSSSAPVAPASSVAPSTTYVAPVSSTPAAVCTEYVDGQPQCSSAAPAPVCTEYVDGQPQCSSAVAPASSSAACTEFVDGQPQCGAPTGVMPTGTAAATGTGVVPYSSYAGPQATLGAAANLQVPAVGLLAAGFAVAMM